MQACKTNQLNIRFNFQQLVKEYTIVKFSTSENFIKYGALILDKIELELNAKSIIFERGKSFYALFDKNYISNVDLSKQLEKIEDGNKLSFKILNKTELELLETHTLSQLLINSIATPNHKRLTFNNLTGKLYLFNPNHLKISKSKDKEQIFKIVGLEFYIDPNCCLQLNVKTFSSVLLSKQMDFSKKKLKEYPKYTFVHSTNTLKRVLPSESIKGENLFILKQTSKKGSLEKNNIPFFDFSNLNEFKNSKIGMLSDIFDSIKEKLSNYLSIEFKSAKTNNVIRHSITFDYSKLNESIFLIDGIKDENSNEHLESIKGEIENHIPNSKIELSKKENKTGYNFKLIHNKSFYQKYEQKDPYKPSNNIQHITSEDFKLNSKASIKAIIKELVIKNDIRNKKISIIDWSKYNYKNKWIFGIKSNIDFYFLTIEPNGVLSYEKFEADLFNQSEYDELCSIYDNDSNIEFIVKDDIGNINIIKRTSNFTLPEFEKINDTLIKENSKISIKKDLALSVVNEVFETEKVKEFENKIKQIENWNKENLLNCFKNRNDKKIFVEKVKQETGEVLKSYFRDKSRYEILDSQLDIHSFKENERNYYFVGIKGKGIQQSISRASVIRKIETYGNSEYVFEKLLPLMNVDFVKNGDLTVLPFPIKYLREWKKY
ncbi:putative ATPase [Tenacibaculum dicentrarchi]|uniref:ATPase n=1 Tax=Tenacibaculum dicentrarchi TaxID=669041 RepID=A0ABM9NXK1_9FLAO|nr:putative ATPase [Tenacibaculum dicentrarchi]